MPFNVKGALQAGYSQDEINQFLAQQALASQAPPTTTMPEVSPQTQQPVRGGLFSNISNSLPFLRNLIPATSNVVQDVSQTLTSRSKPVVSAQNSIELAQQQLSDVYKQAVMEQDPVKRQKIIEYAKQQAKDLNLGSQETNNLNYSPDINKGYAERGLASGAELAPFMVAWGAKGATAPARILSMAGQGASASGLRTATSLQDMTPEERAMATAKSALIGGAVAGGLQTAGEIYNKMGAPKTPVAKVNKTDQGINNVKMNPKEYDPYGEAQQTQQAINERLGTGSAIDKMKRYPKAMDNLNQEIKAELTTATKVPPSENIVGQFRDNLATHTINDTASNAYVNAQKTMENQIIQASQGNNPAEVAQNLYELKSRVGDSLAPVFTKLTKGTPLTPIEEARYAAWSTLKGALGEISPEIGQLNNTQHLLIEAKAPLIKSSQLPNPSVPLPGALKGITLPVTNAFSQTARSAAANALGNASQLNVAPWIKQAALPLEGGVSQITNQAILPTASALVSNQALPKNVSQQEQSVLGQSTVNPQLAQAQEITQPEQPTYQNQWNKSPAELYRAYEQARDAKDYKNAEIFKQTFTDELAAQKLNTPKPLTLPQQQSKSAAKMALQSIQSLKQELGMVDAQGNETGKVNTGEIWKDTIDPRTHALETDLNNALLTFQAARATRGINANENSLAFLKKNYGYSIKQSPEVVRKKIKYMEDYLNTILNEAPASSDVSAVSDIVPETSLGY